MNDTALVPVFENCTISGPEFSQEGGRMGGHVHWALPFSPWLLSSPADFRDLYTKVLEEEAASVSSADTGQACG